jgi:hypothetical protein
MQDSQVEELLDRLTRLSAIAARQLDVLSEINTKLPSLAGEPRSSAQVETNSRGTTHGVKVYAGSPVRDVVNEAAVEYARLGLMVSGEPSLPEAV